MLRKILFSSLVVLALASCKKDKDDAPANHVSAKVNGVKTDFNASASATKLGDASTGYIVMIVGLGSTSTLYPAMNINISDDAAITARTYTAANDEADASYMVNSSDQHSSVDDFTVTVTSVTNTEIKGTFSGKVENMSGTVSTITEGTFSAKF